MTVNIQFVAQPLTFPADNWDCWLPAGHFSLTQRFLQCAQCIDISDFSLAPHTLHDQEGAPIGVCASYQCTIDGADLGSPKLQRIVRGVRRVIPNLLRMRTLEIGNPAALGFPLRSLLPPADSVHSLASWAIEKAQRERYDLVVIRDIESTEEQATAEALFKKGFFRSPLPPTYIVSLPFASFAEYLAALRSRYRNHYKNCMAGSTQLSVEILADFSSLSTELLRLWQNIYERAGKYHRVQLTAAFFHEASALPESQLLLLKRPDRSIAGFALLFIDGPMLRYS
ncbi:MAG: hypothetical protein EOO81_10670, partial [Oxalobacteraceae bacterium]